MSEKVVVNLDYNPYTLETRLTLNEKKPRVNCFIEKYTDQILQNWVSQLPNLLYNEMNGYGFGLEFEGTTLEYEAIKKALKDANVKDTPEGVKPFHKRTRESRMEKLAKVEELFDWLEANPNERFNFDETFGPKEYAVQEAYSCIVIDGDLNENSFNQQVKVAIERIDDVNELEETQLQQIPIVLCIDEDSKEDFKNKVRYLLSRKDVTKEQLFFVIDPRLNRSSIERVISDIGANTTNVVNSKNLNEYLEIYPITDQIHKVIMCFRPIVREMEEMLTISQKKSKAINNKTHKRLKELELELKNIKGSIEQFENRDNFHMSEGMTQKKELMLISIEDWRKKKTKITKEVEAVSAAVTFNGIVNKLFEEFLLELEKIEESIINAIDSMFYSWYGIAETDVEFEPVVKVADEPKVQLEPLTQAW